MMRDERLSDVLTTERPSALRLGGFLLTVVGGALIALGSLLTWVTVTYHGLSSSSPGVDLRPGIVCLVAGVAVILSLLVLRLSRSTSVLRIVSIGVAVAGVLALGLGVRELAIKDHLLFTGVHDFADALHAQTGLPTSDLAARLRTELQKSGSVSPGIGLWLTIVGGVLAIGGGILDLRWVRSRATDRSPALDAPPAAG
jgi:hypothetical protein